MNWYKVIKLASIRYLYHGTSINNLGSVLSEGLNSYHSSVYDETFQNERGTRSVESYDGVYLTDNMRTALMAGYQAAKKNKVDTNTSVLVIVQVEDKTPSILIDEDLLTKPYRAIKSIVTNFSYRPSLAEWIFNGFPNIEVAVNNYLEDLSSGRTVINDNRFLEGIKPYVYEMLKTFAIKILVIDLRDEFPGTGRITEDIYPDLKNLPDIGTAIQNYRDSSSLFMQKANRLTEFFNEDTFQNNMRVTEPLSFRGKNKIILISTFKKNDDDERQEYDYSIDILYLSNSDIIDQYMKDIEELYSPYFIIKENGYIIYDNKKEEVLSKV